MKKHLAVYMAILNQDEIKARQTMLTHLENVELVIQKYFDETKVKSK